MYRNLDVQVAIVLMIICIGWLVTAVAMEAWKEYKNNRSN